MSDIIKDRVYLGPIGQSPHKVEFSGDGWKITGWAQNIELNHEVECEETIYGGYESYTALSNVKHTVKFELANVDNHLYTLTTTPQKTPVDKVKDVLRGHS